jgi:hypothetical protein
LTQEVGIGGETQNIIFPFDHQVVARLRTCRDVFLRAALPLRRAQLQIYTVGTDGAMVTRMEME